MSIRVAANLVLISLAGCTPLAKQAAPEAGSWFMKDAAPRTDQLSRRLLIGRWHSESTDLHAIKRIEDLVRSANGTYVIHFIELSEAGKITTDQKECGLWGVSGDIYFTITQAIRTGESGARTSPYSATYYDAYKVVLLTKEAFDYKHVATGELMHANKVNESEHSAAFDHDQSAVSPCLDTST